MMVVDRATGALQDDRFPNLPHHLHAGDLLILNDSRVLPARLYAHRLGLNTQAGSPAPSGSIEVLLTQQLAPHEWSALVRPGRKVQAGETLVFPDADGEPVLTAEVLTAGDFGERTLRFAPDTRFLEHLDRIGHMPLPPYIQRPKAEPDSQQDKTRYQTVYAAQPGSAAAPTAGLHFTPEIIAELRAKGVQIETITLHVGLGTFQPVRVERVEDIRLHTEHYTLPAATAAAINHALAEKRRIIAAGTTTTRTLEHCAATAPGAPGHDSETWFQPSNPTPAQPASSSAQAIASASSPACSPTFTCRNRPCSCWSAPSSRPRVSRSRADTAPSRPTPTPSTSATASSATATAC
jgi:S-adenosylmethionine:tRNA ribosyltransferase-isomerase